MFFINCENLKKYPQNSPFLKKSFGGINVDLLRFIAVFCMLLDHAWVAVIPGNNWMNYLGRIAFPIFAFQIAEGFIHTSNLKKYFLRLFVAALLSEIPFNLLCSGEVFYPQYQNVLFNFVLGILAVFLIDRMKKDPTPKTMSVSGILLVCLLVIAEYSKVDYGIAGLLTVVAFYIFRDFPFAWILQLISLLILNIFVFSGRPFLVKIFGNIYSFHVQIFAVFSLIPIWFYNGKKGKGGKALQYGFYAFYPLHMLLLFLLSKTLN